MRIKVWNNEKHGMDEYVNPDEKEMERIIKRWRMRK